MSLLASSSLLFDGKHAVLKIDTSFFNAVNDPSQACEDNVSMIVALTSINDDGPTSSNSSTLRSFEFIASS
jgi:hypothetical protein